MPWAWGVNGALSVSGSVLTRILSTSMGFTTVLAVMAALYVAAGLLFPVNGSVGDDVPACGNSEKPLALASGRTFQLRNLGKSLVLQGRAHQLQELFPRHPPLRVAQVPAEVIGERTGSLAADVGVCGILV